MSSHDSGAVSKASGVCSPAVAALPFYRNSDVHSPAARFGVANYAASVVPGALPYKQVHGILMLIA